MGNCISISISISISEDQAICRCWNGVVQPLQYICKLEQNLQALEAVEKTLREHRDDVDRRVNLAKELLMEPLQTVEGWLERVENTMNEVEQIRGDALAQIHNLCLGGYFSKSCWSGYKFGKKVVQKTKDVANLRTEGNFTQVAESRPTASVNVRPSEPTVGLESTLDKVWTCLIDEGSNIIGLYGMGGVGKTTLLIQVNNELQQTRNNLDIVIWATVSKNHTIEKVQDEIGRKIGYSDQSWKQKSCDEKAIDIFAVLSTKKFVLLLDDIWERVDLVKVGIPIPGHGSKLIFTTRSLDVCGQMEAHRKIKVDCLAPDEAWELFQKKVGEETIDSDPQIRELAKKVKEECKGLPLALITIGRAMSSKKALQQWKYAIRILRRSAASYVFPGMRKEVYPLLKFSYDSLPDDKLKSCFLYCVLFPEDFLINKCELIDYWIAEGFLDEYNGICDRNEGHDIICALLGSCLLEEVDVEHVKMHDVIRDMALWIARDIEKEKYIVETSAQLTEVPEIENWGMIKRLSMMNNYIQSLRGMPNCLDLRTLFLGNNCLRSICLGKDFFQFMDSLTVLNLSNNLWLTDLPVGISNLVSLQCLNISCTLVRELPMELSSLSKLKCLNLEKTLHLDTIPEELIRSFSRLQVLRLGKTGYFRTRVIEGNISFSKLKCLECLKYLNALTITICSDSALEGFLSSHRLQGCTEELYIDQPEYDSVFSLKTLCLPPMKRLQFLSLELTSLEEVKIEWKEEGRNMHISCDFQTSVIASERNFYNLWMVNIEYCPNLRDITWIIFAPNLRNLFVSACHGMEEIISEAGVAAMTGDLILFEKLQNLILSFLPELKSIHKSALPFPCLDVIRVDNCPKLRKIPLNSNSAKGRRIIIRGEQQWWDELEWEDDSTQGTFLSSFQPY